LEAKARILRTLLELVGGALAPSVIVALAYWLDR
jgi:hypothetical protein